MRLTTSRARMFVRILVAMVTALAFVALHPTAVATATGPVQGPIQFRTSYVDVSGVDPR